MEAWREGKLIFDETALGDAVRDVNRYAARPITLDPSLVHLKVSGVFQIAHLGQFAQTLADSFGLRVQDGDNAITIVTAP
jgi:transmembrane sensor